MSNLDNLVSKITDDGELRVNNIIKEATVEAEKNVSAKISQANTQRDKILEEGAREASMAKAQIISGKTLEIRDGKLNAKQEMIKKTFDAAVEKLNNIDEDGYTKFLKGFLLTMNIEGDEGVITPKRFSHISLEDVNTQLSSKGKKGNLSVITDAKEIKGGFVLIKDGIENDNSFEALLDYYKEELESVVVENLF